MRTPVAEDRRSPVAAHGRNPRAHGKSARITWIGAPTRRQWRLLVGVASAALLLVLTASYLRQLQKPTHPQRPTESSRAEVSNEPYDGPFATGQGLSFDALVQPLHAAPVKEIRIDASNRLIDLAPGVKYSAWTLGDQVPGPTVRVRVGDRVRYTMSNRTDEMMPGRVRFKAPMMHSMDFHSAEGSPQNLFHSIPPGQTISYEFTPAYPGVFMYHCVTPPMVEHVAAGMYGVMIVEPANGYPTKADREYVIVQSEFYAKPDPKGRKVDDTAVYVMDTRKALARDPTHVVFNGRFNGMMEKPLVAKPGERVRLFVLNIGPGSTSSFHVVGAIFDRVWIEGNPRNELRGLQSVLLGASSGAIVEFMVPEKGEYIMVDHHFANAALGAVGVINASESSGTLLAPGHPGAAPAATDPDAEKGRIAFEAKCAMCHTLGSGDKIGPDLGAVTRRRTEAWLIRWLLETDTMLETDPAAKEMLAKYKTSMPNQGLTPAEARQILRFFQWSDRNHGQHAKK
jgi:nitrite reductase (NO-forming)